MLAHIAMDYVLLAALVGIVVVAVFTVRGAIRSQNLEKAAREDYEQALAQGSIPASLYPSVDLNTCLGTGNCVEVCPEKDVLGIIGGKARIVNPTSCIGHGECHRACPVQAISLVIGSEKRGVDIPLLKPNFETSAPGVFVVGELGGMGLIYNAMNQAVQCVQQLAKKPLQKISGVHELVIVGAGPAGLAASVTAKNENVDFVTLDQESVGGTVLHYPRQKIVMTRPVELPGYGWVRLDTIEKESLLNIWLDIVDRVGLSIQTETKVEKIHRERGVLLIETSKGALRAQRVILALGRRGSPRRLGVPGEELGNVTYRLIEPDAYTGKRCLVVGGGDSAVETALSLVEAGALVRLVHRGKVFDRIKMANRRKLEEAEEAEMLHICREAEVKRIERDAVTLSIGGKPHRFRNNYVIIQAGGVLPKSFLESIGIEVQRYQGEVFAPANPS